MESTFLRGAVEMMVLDVLSHGPSYGYQITQEVFARSHEQFELKEGSLYPALHRMERAGLLESYWEQVAEKRRRKYYRLTAQGVAELDTRREEWMKFTAGVNGVLGLRGDALA